MVRPHSDLFLDYYKRRYIERVGRAPRRKDLNPVLARALLRISGDLETSLDILNAWFDSSDPWYASEGFGLEKCFGAINRLFAQGDIVPKPKWGTAHQKEVSRKLAIAMFLKPTLTVVQSAKN